MEVTAPFRPFRNHAFTMLPSSSTHATPAQVLVAEIAALGFIKELAEPIKQGVGFGDLQGI